MGKAEELQELKQLPKPTMPTLLSTASSRPDAWSVQAPTKATRSMEMARLKFEDGAAILQLIAKSDLGDVFTPWTPNVHRGDGSEARVTMTVNIPDHLREDIEAERRSSGTSCGLTCRTSMVDGTPHRSPRTTARRLFG